MHLCICVFANVRQCGPASREAAPLLWPFFAPSPNEDRRPVTSTYVPLKAKYCNIDTLLRDIQTIQVGWIISVSAMCGSPAPLLWPLQTTLALSYTQPFSVPFNATIMGAQCCIYLHTFWTRSSGDVSLALPCESVALSCNQEWMVGHCGLKNIQKVVAIAYQYQHMVMR